MAIQIGNAYPLSEDSVDTPPPSAGISTSTSTFASPSSKPLASSTIDIVAETLNYSRRYETVLSKLSVLDSFWSGCRATRGIAYGLDYPQPLRVRRLPLSEVCHMQESAILEVPYVSLCTAHVPQFPRYQGHTPFLSPLQHCDQDLELIMPHKSCLPKARPKFSPVQVPDSSHKSAAWRLSISAYMVIAAFTCTAKRDAWIRYRHYASRPFFAATGLYKAAGRPPEDLLLLWLRHLVSIGPRLDKPTRIGPGAVHRASTYS